MHLYVIPKNDDVVDERGIELGCTRWKSFTGKSPDMAMLYFNQNSLPEFTASIPYIVNLGRVLKRQLPQIQPIWSVPFPGSGQLEAIVASSLDGVYRLLFSDVLALYDPKNSGRIPIRVAWEFNLHDQENAGRDKRGNWDTALYQQAFRHIVGIARSVSPRFSPIWCPNIFLNSAPHPESFYPGDDVVDTIGVDAYFWDAAWSGQTFANMLAPPNDVGLQWLSDFARHHGKTAAICEFGADSDHFAPEVGKLFAAAPQLGISWIVWWDRQEVINCRISDGSLPAIGDVVRKAS